MRLGEVSIAAEVMGSAKQSSNWKVQMSWKVILALIQGDSFRGRLWSSGSTLHEDEEKSKIDVIMHRQHADFYSFL